MFPWFLCLLGTSPSITSSRNQAEDHSSHSIWWNPVGSSNARNLNGFKIYQGDILLMAGSNEKLKNAIKSSDYLWKNGVVPYEFGDNFTSPEKNMILEAMALLEEKSCVKFVENEEEETFISFQKERNGCYAPIGRLPGNYGLLPVNLQSPECFREVGIIQHELLHVIGLFHEQSRPDRDDHVTIHWCNIEHPHEIDFLKGTCNELETFQLPYDFGSIMHYPKWAFSKNGLPTITAKLDPNMTLGQREGPSEADIQKVRMMYKCQ